jgi:hypothetical protein
MFHSNPLFPTFNHLPCQASIKIIAFFAQGGRAKIQQRSIQVGRLEQENRLAKDDSMATKIIYKYDAAGKQTGYAMFDATGKLISESGSPAQSASPKSRNPHGR